MNDLIYLTNDKKAEKKPTTLSPTESDPTKPDPSLIRIMKERVEPERKVAHDKKEQK